MVFPTTGQTQLPTMLNNVDMPVQTVAPSGPITMPSIGDIPNDAPTATCNVACLGSKKCVKYWNSDGDFESLNCLDEPFQVGYECTADSQCDTSVCDIEKKSDDDATVGICVATLLQDCTGDYHCNSGTLCKSVLNPGGYCT
jgi:hypothetical protein